MSKLIYITNASLDGYIEDETGAIDWGNPAQIHEFITELVRPMQTYLYGRRLYETMSYWDAPIDSYPPNHRAFAAVWQKAEKIVYSRTLKGTTTRNTRLEHDFNPDAVRKLKQESLTDLHVGGAELASLALAANLVDECHLFLHPIVLGRGKPAFHPTIKCKLTLLETRRFDTGVVHLRYSIP